MSRDYRDWVLTEIADAARELPYEHQPERLRTALDRLMLIGFGQEIRSAAEQDEGGADSGEDDG